MMIPTERFDDALSYASRLHRHQLRKGTRIPYVAHLLAVAAMVIEHGGNEDQAIAALLHDAAEDQGGEATLQEIRRRYGPAVAAIVADCTDAWTEPKPPWRERKEAYLAILPKKPAASNARAILNDRRQIDDAIWDRFNGGRAGTLWYYGALAACFLSALPGPLADELAWTVDAMGAG
jgi:(p)ppGpp synthase/HD superfamily hydrolase